MITEWFISIGQAIADWFLGLLGTADAPDYITSVGTFIGGILSSAQGLGAWIPWALVIVVAGINLALWLTGFGVKALRWLVGLLPTMGGG